MTILIVLIALVLLAVMALAMLGGFIAWASPVIIPVAEFIDRHHVGFERLWHACIFAVFFSCLWEVM